MQMRSGRWGRGFDPRRLDQKYGETLRLHRIFFVFCDGCEKPRITVGSREKRPLG